MIKFYLKVILKSPLIIISLLFTTYIMLVQSSALSYSINSYTRVTFYGFISFNLFLLLSSTYSMNKNYELSNFLEKNKFKKLIYILLTSLIISSLAFIIPFIVIIFRTFNKFSLSDIFYGTLNYFLLWNLSNLLCSLIGIIVGLLTKRWYSYIFSFIIYSGYISCIYGPAKSIFKKLICTFSDNIFVEENFLAPILFNIPYLLDKVFIILFIFTLINFIYLFTRSKKTSLIPMVSLVTIISLLIGIIPLSNKFAKIGTEDYHNIETADYIIEDYKMDLKTTSTLKNSCTLHLKAINSTNNILFMLDSIFSVNSISIDNEDYTFEHINNKIKLNYNLKENQTVTIKFDYSGFVDISNYLGVNTYYVNNEYINLPDKNFYWYPCINDNNFYDFKINLQTNSDIYTNLNIDDSINSSNKHIYTLSGNDAGFCICAGNYQSITIDNITYIVPKQYKIDLFKQYIDKLSERILADSSSIESKNKSDFLKNKQYKKVIVCDWFSSSKEAFLKNEIQFYNDTIIINLGA